MSEEDKNAEIAKLDRVIEDLEDELARMTEQAIKFRDLARSHAALLLRAAEALSTARQGGSMQTTFYAQLIAELHEAAKEE